MIQGTVIGVIGIVCIIAGIVIRMSVSRSEFKRTNEFGVMEYGSYGQAAASQAGGGCARVLGTLMIVGGALMIPLSLIVALLVWMSPPK